MRPLLPPTVRLPLSSLHIADLRSAAPSPGLLGWQVIHDRMPWSLVLLLGGGFALAKATQVSGLSAWMGAQLAVLDFLDARLLVLIVIVATSFATEVTSNVATCSILLPVLRDLVSNGAPLVNALLQRCERLLHVIIRRRVARALTICHACSSCISC